MKHIDVVAIAHRGNSSEAPENTLASFRLAKDLGADFLELDVQLTKDNIPVVFHDDIITRTTNSKHSVGIADLTFEEIRTLDAGSWFHESFAQERIPTLEEALDLSSDLKINVMVEIKKGVWSNEAIVDAVIELVKFRSNVHLASLSSSLLKVVKDKIPNKPLISVVKTTEEFKDHALLQTEIMAINHEILSKRIAEAVHTQKQLLWTWTVDDFETARRCILLGTNGIITNRPRHMLEFFNY